MSYFSVDIEADGSIPGDYSMILIGAVLIKEGDLTETFYGKLKPISKNWNPDALKISGFTREETLKFNEPMVVMQEFKNWINKVSFGTPRFVADNLGFDWMFTCWYFNHFLGSNPFGFSGNIRINNLWHGIQKDVFSKWKWLRDTKHTHNPVDDAIGNAEVLIKLKNNYNLKIRFK